MKPKTKQYITVAVTWIVLLSLFVGLIGPVHAQDSGPTISGSYDYGNDEVDYTISGEPFSNPYEIQELEEQVTYQPSFSDLEAYEFTHSQEVVTAENSELYRYELTTDWNLNSRGSGVGNFDPLAGTLTDDDNIIGFTWSDDGTKFFVTGSTGSFSQTHQYSTNTPYRFDSPTLQETDNHGTYEMQGLEWVDSDTLLSIHSAAPYLRVFNCDSDYDISSCTTTDHNLPADFVDSRSIDTNDAGTRIYISQEDGRIARGDLSDSYEPSSIVSEINPQSIQFVEWVDSGNTLTGYDSSLGGTIYNVATYPVDVWLTDTSGDEISGTRQQITSSTSGSISYAPNTYQQVDVNFQNTELSSKFGQSDTITIYGDGNISIREEQTNDLVTSDVNVTAYGEESGIYSLDTSDGTIDITGLPDQAYTFIVDSEGYYQRARYIDQLGNADNFYLLDNSTTVVTSQFNIEDRTGVYSQDSRLVIRRSISGNGNDWETIISDSFGSEGLTLDLQENVRYRLYVETDTQTQLIGPYRASISESVTVSPTSGEIDVNQGDYWSAGAQYNNQEIDVRFVDPTNETDSVSVTIYERGNDSNVLVSNDFYTNPSDLMLEYPVSNQYNESNWVVEMEITRDTQTYSTSFTVGPTANVVPTELDDFWRKMFAVVLMLTFGLVFSTLNKAVGSIIYACMGGMFYWIGLLEGLTTGALIVAYFFIVIVYNIYMKT